MALIDKLTAIADAIRGKTGGTDALTLDRMAAAIAGIETGGGSGGASGIYMAKVTPASDSENLTIMHNLGTTDILCASAWAETLGDVTPTFGGALGKWWAKTDIPNNRSGVGFTTQAGYNATNAYATCSGPNSEVYWDKVIDDNTFEFNRAGAAATEFIAGVTYTVIIIAASAFKETEG